MSKTASSYGAAKTKKMEKRKTYYNWVQELRSESKTVSFFSDTCVCVCSGKSIVPCAPIQPSSMFTQSPYMRAPASQTTGKNNKTQEVHKKEKIIIPTYHTSFSPSIWPSETERAKYACITLHSRLHVSLFIFFVLHILHLTYNTHRARKRFQKIASVVKNEKKQETEKTA